MESGSRFFFKRWYGGFKEKAWYFNSWDKFLLPKPFSKVILRFGEMIKFDRVKDREILERQRMRLEEIMLPALRCELNRN